MREPELARAPRTQAGKQASERLRTRVAIAKAIIGARLQRGWTQLQLADAAGTKQSRISELESIKGNPTLETVDRVASVLGLQLSLKPPAISDAQRFESRPTSFNTFYVLSNAGPASVYSCDRESFEVNSIPRAVVERMGKPSRKSRYA